MSSRKSLTLPSKRELILACETYKTHLKQRITQDNQRVEPTDNQIAEYAQQYQHNGKNTTLVLACKKLTIVEALESSLKNDDSPQWREEFKKILNQEQQGPDKTSYRKILETRNDSAGITFLKIIATLFILPVILFGLWKVHGQEFLKEIDPQIPSSSPPSGPNSDPDAFLEPVDLGSPKKQDPIVRQDSIEFDPLQFN